VKILKNIFTLSLVAVLLITFVPVFSAHAAEKVNINKASVQEIAQLDRIGLKYAERIVQYRQEYGLFEKPEDIMKVRGIGPKTFETNKDRITIE
jgi:competence protein ComEA